MTRRSYALGVLVAASSRHGFEPIFCNVRDRPRQVFACCPRSDRGVKSTNWPKRRGAEGLLLAWLFVLGTLIGSFANVVVHRLPRRRSLLWPPSHCPRCKHAIRWRDNLPIVGWMLLDGKCRDCGLPISPQYVFVETMFGILLATIGWLEGVEGRANLPVRTFLLPGDLPPSNWIFVAYHMLLVGTLACAALMQQDRKPISRSLLVFSGWWGLALPLVWTAIRPVPLGLVLPEMLRVSSAMLAVVEGAAGCWWGFSSACSSGRQCPQGAHRAIDRSMRSTNWE